MKRCFVIARNIADLRYFLFKFKNVCLSKITIFIYFILWVNDSILYYTLRQALDIFMYNDIFQSKAGEQLIIRDTERWRSCDDMELRQRRKLHESGHNDAIIQSPFGL